MKGRTTNLLLFEVIEIGDGDGQGVIGYLRSVIEQLVSVTGHSN